MIQLLIVDDEWTIRQGLEKTIPWQDWGIQIAGTAKNGVDALQQLEQTHADIVLTDIKMPGMNGLELAEACKKRFPQCKVIILTGHDEFEYAQKGIRIGVDDFLLKPTDFEELKTIMQKTVHGIQQTKKDQSQHIGQQIRDYLSTRNSNQFEMIRQSDVLVPSFVMIRSRQPISDLAITISSKENEHIYLLNGVLSESDVETYVQKLVDSEHTNTIHISCVIDRHEKLEEIYHQVKVASEPWMKSEAVEVFRYRDEKYTLQLEHVIQAIQARYKETLSQTEFAETLHMSNSYFSRMFKSHTGMKFSDYIVQVRIEAAKQLLQNTDLKTYEIADQVGIQDSRYFSTVFRKQVGMTPAEFRSAGRGLE